MQIMAVIQNTGDDTKNLVGLPITGQTCFSISNITNVDTFMHAIIKKQDYIAYVQEFPLAENNIHYYVVGLLPHNIPSY